MYLFRIVPIFILALSFPLHALALDAVEQQHLELTHSWVGYISIFVFVLAYSLVVSEEFTHLRKSKPVILAAGIIWAMIGLMYARAGIDHAAEEAIKDLVDEFGELFLFLLTAMCYVHAMKERRLFESLRC